MASIEIRKVCKSYRDADVLKNIDIGIEDGEFIVLVGPSGCGKSTLLRMVSGLETISSGEILIDGRVVNQLPPKDRDIAMVFQNYALYPHMTVAENMGFSMKMRGEPAAVIQERVRQAAAILGLEGLMRRYPKQLSGGQRQRVAMGRAIVRDPAVFLFDEPLSNLDAKLRVQMRTEIKALHQRLGSTMIYVTHDQIEAMTMADRIVVLRDGAVEQIGRPMELYERPANRFVAEFIGSPGMNILAGTVSRDGAGCRLITDGGQSLPLPPDAAAWAGRACHYGVRPEHVRIEGHGFAARVVSVEPTGPESHVIVEGEGGLLTCVVRGDRPFSAGQTIHLAPEADKVHLFDAATGRRAY